MLVIGQFGFAPGSEGSTFAEWWDQRNFEFHDTPPNVSRSSIPCALQSHQLGHPCRAERRRRGGSLSGWSGTEFIDFHINNDRALATVGGRSNGRTSRRRYETLLFQCNHPQSGLLGLAQFEPYTWYVIQYNMTL